LILCVGIAALVAEALIVPRVQQRLGENIEETLSPPLSVMAESLGDAYGRGTADDLLARARRRFRAPLEIVPGASVPLTGAERERFARGEVVRTDGFLRSVLYVAIPGTDRAIHMGPINPVHPLGEGRGLAMLLLFVGGLSLGTFVLVRPIRRRLGGLARAADAFGRGELSTRASDLGERDAIHDLGAAFNGMADRIERLIAAHQELLRMVSHELRTPMQRLHFTVERVRDAATPEERERALARATRDLDELDALIDELLTYVRLRDGAPPRRDPIEIAPVLQDLDTELGDLHDDVRLAVHVPAPGLRAGIEPRLLRRALANLVVNALRHARTRVQVRATVDDTGIAIDVDDDGPGVPPADRARLFEPFQRLDADPARGRRGAGLGLAIVHRIADLHGGRVTIDTSDLGGARFRLTLPAA
jgi:signal transduction histidine kinase